MRAWVSRQWHRVWDWFKDSVRYLLASPLRLMVFLGAVVGGLIAGAPVGDAGYDYLWRDPNFCNDCHVHDYADDAWARSVHAGVTTCHDCHLVPFMHYPVMGAGTFINPPQSPEEVKKAHVASVICEACHMEESTHELTGPMTAEMRVRIVKIDESPLHRLHIDSETRDPGAYLGEEHGIDDPPRDAEGVHAEEGGGHGEPHGAEEEGAIVCMDCHGSGGNLAAHRFTAARSNCLECHGGIDVAVGRLTELRCAECHYTGFVGRPGTEPPVAAVEP